MSGAQRRVTDPRDLAVVDNVPPGCVVSLAGLPGALSFASFFREELQAKGFGIAAPVRHGAGNGQTKRD